MTSAPAVLAAASSSPAITVAPVTVAPAVLADTAAAPAAATGLTQQNVPNSK